MTLEMAPALVIGREHQWIRRSRRSGKRGWFLACGVLPIPPRAVETSRLETFADGVFAIAATLLIIDVSVNAFGAELVAELMHSWPQYAA